MRDGGPPVEHLEALAEVEVALVVGAEKGGSGEEMVEGTVRV